MVYYVKLDFHVIKKPLKGKCDPEGLLSVQLRYVIEQSCFKRPELTQLPPLKCVQCTYKIVSVYFRSNGVFAGNEVCLFTSLSGHQSRRNQKGRGPGIPPAPLRFWQE